MATFFLLPLWEKVAWTKSAPDEGPASAEPLTRLASDDASHPLKGRGYTERASARRSNFKQPRQPSRHNLAFSPRIAPEVCRKFPSTLMQRAQGMPGARCTRSLACEIKLKHTSVVTTVTPENIRHSPRNGFNGFL